MIKKYENQCNVVSNVIKNAREIQKFSKAKVCRMLQFYAINIEPTDLYRIETNQRIVKDFEVLGLCAVLNIKYDNLKELLLHI